MGQIPALMQLQDRKENKGLNEVKQVKKEGIVTLCPKNTNLPDLEKCPAPMSHFRSSKLSSIFISRNLATNFAGSQ
jgi:hypothetical protein